MTTIIEDKEVQLAREGEAYTIYHFWNDLADTSTGEFYIENPSGNDEARAVHFHITPGGDGVATIQENVNVDTSGTSFTAVNQRVGEPNGSGLNIEYGGTYSGGSEHIKQVLNGGQKDASAGPQEGVPPIILPPGNNILIQTTNQSGSPNDYDLGGTIHIDK